MTNYRTEQIRINELLRMNDSKRLVIQPKFQRRSVWPSEAQSYLIDTIIQGIPMPKIYLREIQSNGQRITEVVDGQQRLRAITGFGAGQFAILSRHQEKYGGMYFSDLPFSVQREFLEYEMTAEILANASDEDVSRLFARLNRYTVRINSQEDRHARFAGVFRQTVYQLSDKHIRELMALKVISEARFQRMREAELISDILGALVDGISDITKLDEIYERYDSGFPKQQEATGLYSQAFEYLDDSLGETIRQSKFRNSAWFYSLMVAAADAMEGIPGGYGQSQLANPVTVSTNMQVLEQAIADETTRPDLYSLRAALKRATSHVPQRTVRHKWFYELLTSPRSI